MAFYLDALKSTLPETQVRQIDRMLRERRDRGQISTLQEYKDQLAELTERLRAERIQPTLALFLAKTGELIDEETYVEMLKRVEDDLNTANTEADLLWQVRKTHHNLIEGVILEVLRRSVRQLERRVAELRFLNGDTEGFDTVQINEFDGGEPLITSRSSVDAGLLYQDFSALQPIDAPEEGEVDLWASALRLSLDSSQDAEVSEVRQVFDAFDPQSELIVEYPGSSLRNAVDGAEDTFWLYSCLRTTPLTGGLNVTLELQLRGGREVSFLEIQPASIRPMELSEVSCIDASNRRTTLFSGALRLDGKSKVFFPKTTAYTIYVTLRQPHILESQFELRPGQELLFRTAEDLETDPNVQLVEPALREAFSDGRLLNEAFGISEDFEPGEMRRYLEYQVGVDNIRVGAGDFKRRGVFVSEVIERDKIRLIGLSANTIRTSSTSFNHLDAPGATPFYHNSIEFWAVKKNFDASSAFQGVQILPLLPRGQTIVEHERLFLLERTGGSTVENTGFLRFWTNNLAGVSVYRNGTLLGAADRTVLTADGTLLTNDTPNNGQRMRVAVRIAAPRTSDIYTVSYTPAVSNVSFLNESAPSGLSGTATSRVDLVGDESAILGRNNIIVFPRLSPISAKSQVYLVIILRANSVLDYVTPEVLDYTLSVGGMVSA